MMDILYTVALIAGVTAAFLGIVVCGLIVLAIISNR